MFRFNVPTMSRPIFCIFCHIAKIIGPVALVIETVVYSQGSKYTPENYFTKTNIEDNVTFLADIFLSNFRALLLQIKSQFLVNFSRNYYFDDNMLESVIVREVLSKKVLVKT